MASTLGLPNSARDYRQSLGKYAVCFHSSFCNFLLKSVLCSLQNQALVAANEIINVFHKEDISSIGKARKLAEEVFGVGWQAKGAGIYDEGEKDSRVWGIGMNSSLI